MMARWSVTSLAGAALLVSCASGASASNPLIGRWHLQSWVKNTNPNWLAAVCSDDDLSFSPTAVTTQTARNSQTIAVSYNVQPTRVVVSSANDVIYILLDANHIRRDDMGKCTYRRVG